MASPDASAAPPSAELTCCGQDGTWSPKAGEPIATSCQICPQSPTYFRRQPRADGRPYEPVKPLGEVK